MKKRSSLNGLLLLVISVVAFAGLGIGNASPRTLALIIGVLFIHELGHYLAMRFFKYRELRMFFLPMFGAAVSGKHFNVAGWKKATVSLMGPVPGIFLGAALGAYAILSGNHFLTPAAMMFMGLNVLNLLPIVPLDGGWFWNAVLFSRHRWLEAAFKIFAGGLGLLAAWAGLGWIGLLLGITTLLSVPVTLTVGNAAGRLRRAGYEPSATEDDTVPRPTAEAIFTELDVIGKGKFNAKTLATHGLQVFERVNAKPPNWLESIGLSAVYFVSIIVAIGGFSLLALAELGATKSTEEPVKQAASVLDARYQGEFQHAPATRGDERYGRRLLIAMFPSSEAAGSAYAQLLAEKSEAIDLQQFGQSVLLTAPNRKNPGMTKAAGKLRDAGAKVFDDDTTKGFFRFNLAATAPNPETAAQIQRAFDTWLGLPTEVRPTAPWLVDQTTDRAKQEAIERSSATYLKIEKAKNAALEDPELRRRHSQSMLVALFSGREKIAKRHLEMVKAHERAQRTAVERLQAANDPTLDSAVLAHELKRPAYSAKDYTALQRWQSDFRPLLTHEPAPAPSEDDNAAADLADQDEPANDVGGDVYMSGEVRQDGAGITFTEVSFADYPRDLPAFTNYLIARGCSDIRYGINAKEYSSLVGGAPELED